MTSNPHRPVRHHAPRQEHRSAGLLVEVIRTLTTSPSAAQKELQKERLEKDFEITGHNVDKLLNANQQDLSTSLQSFRKVSSQLTMARQRVRSAKDSLSSCKLLLQCKRDELKKLWLESAEQKHVSKLLEQVETVKTIPWEVGEAMGKKLYLQAAQLISSADTNFEGNLRQVEALRETMDVVHRKKQELLEILCDDLNRQLYIKPSEELFGELCRVASMRRAGIVVTPEEVTARLNMPNTGQSRFEPKMAVLREDGCASEESIDDQDSHQRICVVIDAAWYLRKLPELIEDVKRSMQRGLAKVVHYTTVYAREYLSGPESASANDNRLLAELLQLLFRQFRIVAALHETAVTHIKRVCERRKLDTTSYAAGDVWEQIQLTLQNVLNDYLDIKNGGAVVNGYNSGQLPETLSSYFSKRKPAAGRAKKNGLFRFDATTHAIKVAAYVREQKLSTLPSLTGVESAEQCLICAPTPENAIVIFKPLMKFLNEIENSAGAASTILRSFMEDYVRTHYLPKIQNEFAQRLETILMSNDAWETLWTGEEAKRLDASMPLLASTVRVAEMCRSLEVLMNSAPAFASRFAELWLQVLGEYRKMAQSIYENVSRSIKQDRNVQVERTKISAAWAVDVDISRLLKSLPNWMALAEQSAFQNTPFSPAASSLTPLVESAEDIRQRNMRESEILIANLGTQKRIEDHEVLVDDPHRLRLLANIHESIEWFCKTVRMYLYHLQSNVSAKLREKADGAAESLQQQFEHLLLALDEMACTCLLMLHLEVRVHCFYFLLPLAKQTVSASHGQDVDEQVIKLNKDLLQLHDTLSTSLQTRKIKYVFEGLGHLVSAIFINSVNNINKINDSAKKRMCKNVYSIQQCLSTITGTRESDLDSARRYFELLYKLPDEILNMIVEHGAEFSELEYQALLALAIRSHPVYSSEPGTLEHSVNRLRAIMTERRKNR